MTDLTKKFEGLLHAGNFVVASHGYKNTAGKPAQYTVVLKNTVGDTVTLHSESRSLFEAYPTGERIFVELKQPQQALENFTTEEEE